jgi:hypothetical protein
MPHQFRNGVVSAIADEKMAMVRTKLGCNKGYPQFCGFLDECLPAKSSDFSRQENLAPEIGRKLQVIIAFPNTVPVAQNPAALCFFNLSFANHLLNSSGGINAYLPRRGSAAADTHSFSTN